MSKLHKQQISEIYWTHLYCNWKITKSVAYINKKKYTSNLIISQTPVFTMIHIFEIMNPRTMIKVLWLITKCSTVFFWLSYSSLLIIFSFVYVDFLINHILTLKNCKTIIKTNHDWSWSAAVVTSCVRDLYIRKICVSLRFPLLL